MKFFENNFHTDNKGFTLIEVMIAVGLFVVVMTAGIGAVLSANNSHKKSQSQRAILDTMSFIVEDLSRNIRLGSSYRCPAGVSAGSVPSDDSPFSAPLVDTAPADCPVGAEWPSIAFEGQAGNPTNANDQIVYIFAQNGNGITRLYKSTDSGNTFLPISPADIEFSTSSGFTVVGSYPATATGGSTTDLVQPRVIMRLSGVIKYKTIETPFDIQTTVSQRLIDS